MSDCINCQCEEIVVGKTACDSLHKQNNDRIKYHSLILRDTQLCDIVDQTSKFAYSQWCFNKNITSQLCWLMNNQPQPTPAYNDKALKDEINAIKAENAKLTSALNKIINNLQGSGAWSGGLEGNFNPNRNIATGNINLFSNTVDGDNFIRTNSGKTENDLAGGIS